VGLNGYSMNTEYLREAQSHFNEPILLGFDLARLIGYAEDDEDCYLVVRDPRRGLVWATLVGGCTYLDCLRGRNVCGEWDDFTRLDSLLAMNGAPREAEFMVLSEMERSA
jgi:hypothetical protein